MVFDNFQTPDLDWRFTYHTCLGVNSTVGEDKLPTTVKPVLSGH